MQQLHSAVSVGMPVLRLLSRPHIERDRRRVSRWLRAARLAELRHPFAAFGITPWNPPTGLSFALILLFGVEFLPWLFLAPVLVDGIVRGFALPLSAEISAAAIIGGGYVAATDGGCPSGRS